VLMIISAKIINVDAGDYYTKLSSITPQLRSQLAAHRPVVVPVVVEDRKSSVANNNNNNNDKC
jgi:hypothetical protein